MLRPNVICTRPNDDGGDGVGKMEKIWQVAKSTHTNLLPTPTLTKTSSYLESQAVLLRLTQATKTSDQWPGVSEKGVGSSQADSAYNSVVWFQLYLSFIVISAYRSLVLSSPYVSFISTAVRTAWCFTSLSAWLQKREKWKEESRAAVSLLGFHTSMERRWVQRCRWRFVP